MDFMLNLFYRKKFGIIYFFFLNNFLGFAIYWGDLCWNCVFCRGYSAPGFPESSGGVLVQPILLDVIDNNDDKYERIIRIKMMKIIKDEDGKR